MTGILMPAVSGVVLLWVGVKVVTNQWHVALYDASGNNIIGYENQAISEIITMALGVILVITARYVSKSDFFKTKAIAYDTIE